MDPTPSEPDPQQARVVVDEKAQATAASSVIDSGPSSAATTTTAAQSPPASPRASASPPSPENRKPSRGADQYYSSRSKFDRLGNPIPQNRQATMSTGYGTSKIRLPGDLGAKDPRRPRSPLPPSLPGDLGPNDPRRPRSNNASPAPSHRRTGSDASEAPEEGQRILKDPKDKPVEEDRHETDEESDGETEPDADHDHENDTDEDSKRGRGRIRPQPGRTTSGKSINVREDSEDDSGRETVKWQGGRKPDPTKGESKLSFANDPRIKITPPEKERKEKKRVHPSTAFDIAPSSAATPVTSDDESHIEMRAAQKLSLTMSAVHSTPSAHRVMRQIIRGDYEHFQREAEEGRKRQRMYLVATDISPEAEYALEWTIGTVLRDGDTLFAVYAVDEEAAGSGGDGGVDIGQGAAMVKDTAAIVQGLPTNAVPPPSAGCSPLGAGSDTPRSRSRGVHSSAENERRRALEDVTARCIRLLRKTRLQVRVVVEVFHCKSPRHMITEVIDFLSPTLVIIGSRGRSAVKGVLLGSFSNYLVTKSSVPVMVARKKLRKHSKTKRNRDGTSVPYSGSGRGTRFSNVIEVPSAKGLRVGGWESVGID